MGRGRRRTARGQSGVRRVATSLLDLVRDEEARRLIASTAVRL